MAPSEGTLTQVSTTPLTFYIASEIFHFQMFLLTKSELRDLNTRQHLKDRRLMFETTSIEHLESASEELIGSLVDGNTIILPNVFLAASENGCIVSRASSGMSEVPWKCSVPGSVMGLQWK